MQKISSYLYPNRIFVVVDLASFQTEWNIVYQRPLKIYKGVDNIIEFDFKNAQQRRIDVSNYSIKCIVLDQLGQEVCTVDVAETTLTGISAARIPASAIEHLEPQFLKYGLFMELDDSSRLPIYADTQFGLMGQMELYNGPYAQPKKEIVLDSFIDLEKSYDDNSVQLIFTSEAAEISPGNTVSGNFPATNLNFFFKNLDATLTVQVTHMPVISAGTKWDDVDEITITNTMTTMSTSYRRDVDFRKDAIWLRISYTPTVNNTGSIDKVIVI